MSRAPCPASKAGFREDDMIVEWNGRPVKGTGTYNDLVSKAKPGDKADVLVDRGGRRRTLHLKMGKT